MADLGPSLPREGDRHGVVTEGLDLGDDGLPGGSVEPEARNEKHIHDQFCFSRTRMGGEGPSGGQETLR